MLYIKGFDKNLCCRGFQFEVGKEYKIENDKPLELCSDSVFHFCESLSSVDRYYSCLDSSGNRFCYIECLSDIIKDADKFGCKHIRIVREIPEDELNILLGKVNENLDNHNTGNRNTGDYNTGNHNTGDYNTGDYNTGDHNTGFYNTGNRNTGNRNTGDYNTGDYNTGDYNTGDYNTGFYNTGFYNTGFYNTGDYNTGDYNTGFYNTGNRNTGNRNTGDYNTGDYNTGDYNTGDYNTGDYNTGDYNTGDYNTGIFNACNNSTGVFCDKEENMNIFNIDSGMTLTEFKESIFYQALTSVNLEMTEWDDDQNKTLPIDFKEACAVWWDKMTKENKEIILSMPNFDKKVFKNITGIKV